MWKYWCKALGTKAFDDDAKADNVAIIRSIYILLNVVTCVAIISNTIRHW